MKMKQEIQQEETERTEKEVPAGNKGFLLCFLCCLLFNFSIAPDGIDGGAKALHHALDIPSQDGLPSLVTEALA